MKTSVKFVTSTLQVFYMNKKLQTIKTVIGQMKDWRKYFHQIYDQFFKNKKRNPQVNKNKTNN